MKKLLLTAIACAAPLYAAQAQEVTYTWTTTNQGTHPTAASFTVPLADVLAGQIPGSDVSNISLAYPGLTFDNFTVSSLGSYNAYVNPLTGAEIYHDDQQGLAIFGYAGNDINNATTFLSILFDAVAYSPGGQNLLKVGDTYNALNNGNGDAPYPTSGHWTATFPTISAAVPEPTTWAMMLLGFGGIGFSIRRKRTQVLAQA